MCEYAFSKLRIRDGRRQPGWLRHLVHSLYIASPSAACTRCRAAAARKLSALPPRETWSASCCGMRAARASSTLWRARPAARDCPGLGDPRGRSRRSSAAILRDRCSARPGRSPARRRGQQVFLRIPGVEVILEPGQHVRLHDVVVRCDVAGRGTRHLLQAGEPPSLAHADFSRRRGAGHVEVSQVPLHRLLVAH